MRLQRTYYEVMGLPRTATPQQIKLKYHDLARQFHPDRAQDKVLAERLFVQINIAYRTLMDENKRAVYDSSLYQADAAPANGGGAAVANGSGGSAPQAARAAAVAPQAAQAAKLDIADTIKKAQAAYMGGDRITAHKLCLDVLKIDPRNTDARLVVGDVYADQGRRQEALAEYKQAAESGGMTRLLQEKINRMEAAIVAPSASQIAAGKSIAEDLAKMSQPPPKKGSLFDKLIGRGR